MLRKANSLLIVTLALTLAGCGSSPQEGIQAIDLLDLLPPDTSVEYDDPSAPILKWSFADGLPQGWTVGPNGVKVVQRSDGILLESPDDSPPWLETRVTVDPLRYYALLSEIESEGGDASVLFYAFSDPPYFFPDNRVGVASNPKGGKQTLRFKFPGPDVVEETIRALRLYPGTRKGTTVVKRLILQSRQENFLTSKVLSRSLIELGQEYRHCWRIPGSGIREVTLRLPEKPASLGFSLGSMRGSQPAELAVELLRDEPAGAEIFRQPFPPTAEGWRDRRVDLSPWRGKKVTVRFRVEGRGSRPVRLIGSPVIRTVPDTRRPSVLLIMLDAQRADRLSVYGHDLHTSPHLARLSGEGILFTGAGAPCSWTAPSVTATFTGRYDGRAQATRGHGVGVPDVTTLAERFSRAGYATGGFAGNHLLTGAKGYARGFDSWYLAPFRGRRLTAADLNQRVLRWMRAHKGEETFCYVHYMDPHSPYDAPWPEPQRANDTDSGGIGASQGWREGYISPMLIDGEELNPNEIKEVRRLYDKGAKYTDFQIGRLLASMRREGLLEETAILVTADHGDELQEHGSWGHGITLYQEMLHIPMILRLPDPGAEAGTVVHTPVSLVDVAPTLAAIATLPQGPGSSDGRDMRGHHGPRLFYSLASGHAPLRFSVVQPPWKYIFFNREALDRDPPRTAQGRWLAEHGQPAELLFNLDEDPCERRNLMEQYPEKAAEMRGLMDAWFTDAESGRQADRAVVKPLGEGEKERLRALGYIQ